MGYMELGSICEDSGSAVSKESGIMMWDSRKEP